MDIFNIDFTELLTFGFLVGKFDENSYILFT
jgi:hypothetical protein